MSFDHVALLGAGAIVVVFGFVSLWPRKRWKASPKNNWQQRDGTEMFSEGAAPPPERGYGGYNAGNY